MSYPKFFNNNFKPALSVFFRVSTVILVAVNHMKFRAFPAVKGHGFWLRWQFLVYAGNL